MCHKFKKEQSCTLQKNSYNLILISTMFYLFRIPKQVVTYLFDPSPIIMNKILFT